LYRIALFSLQLAANVRIERPILKALYTPVIKNTPAAGMAIKMLLYLPPQIIGLQKARQNLRLQQIVTIIGIALFIIKVIAWYITRSVAILTDALESTVNVIAGLLGIYSLYVSAKPRDKDHPYGHGKAEFISAAVEGTLITVAGFVIIYEAINNFIHPHQLQQLDSGILLVAITAVINFVLGYICVRTGKRNNSLALISSGKHLQTDTYSTVGIIVGLILLYITGHSWIDSAVAILFAFIIIFTGYKIVRTSIAGIMDEADETLINKMVALLNANRQPNWIDLHNLRIIQYGSTLHVDCHLTVPWYLNVHEAHQEIDALTALVKKEFGQTIEFFVHSDGCLDFSCTICTKQACNVRKQAFKQRVEWTMENISSNNKHQL
jgi:cation diffusion facilitator family transporter